MRWLPLVLLAGCGSRVDADRPAPEVPERAHLVPGTDDIGCDDDGGPCLAVGRHFWNGASDLCIDGAALGTGGTLYWNARARETSSWSETSVCVTASAPELDATIQVVRADGRRSNREAVVTPAFDLEWTVPEPLREGMVYTVTGDNLGTVVFPGASTGQVFHGIAQAGRRPSFQKPGHEEVLGPDVVVHPDILFGCAAGPNQPCTIGGLGFGSSAFATETDSTVRVNGVGVPWQDWTANTVTFGWPAGLGPGLHRRRAAPSPWVRAPRCG